MKIPFPMFVPQTLVTGENFAFSCHLFVVHQVCRGPRGENSYVQKNPADGEGEEVQWE